MSNGIKQLVMEEFQTNEKPNVKMLLCL